MGIVEGHGCRFSCFNGDGFYFGIADPVGIVNRDFLCVQCSNRQIGNRNRTIFTCCERRARYSLGTGGVGIQTNLPARQMFTAACFLHQLYGAGVQLILEADFGCSVSGNRYFLGIGAGTGIECINGAVGVTDFLNVISAGFQICHRNFTCGICCVRAGHKRRTGRIRINTELPAFQILVILSTLGQIQSAGIQLIGETDRGSIVCGNGDLLRVCAGTVVQCIYAAVCVSNLLNIVSSGLKAGDRDLAGAVGAMRSGHQSCAGTVAVNTELPAREVFAIFRSFGQC